MRRSVCPRFLDVHFTFRTACDRADAFRCRQLNTFGLSAVLDNEEGDFRGGVRSRGPVEAFLPCTTLRVTSVMEVNVFVPVSLFVSRIGLRKNLPRVGSRVVSIDPLRFLAGCRSRGLTQALSVLSLSLDFF